MFFEELVYHFTIGITIALQLKVRGLISVRQRNARFVFDGLSL
jgi:cytochrome b561